MLALPAASRGSKRGLPSPLEAAQRQSKRAAPNSFPELPSLSLANKFDAYVWHCDHQLNKAAQDLQLPDLHEQMAGGRHQRLSVSGDDTWSDMQEELSIIFPECWLLQMELVQAIFKVQLRRIYRHELDICIDRLLEDNGWILSDLVNILICIAPRRFGKTEGMAAAVAVFMICIPNFIHVHFPLLKEAGIDFLNSVKGYIERSPRGRRMKPVVTKSCQLVLQGMDGRADERSSKVMSANTKVARPHHTPFLHQQPIAELCDSLIFHDTNIGNPC